MLIAFLFSTAVCGNLLLNASGLIQCTLNDPLVALSQFTNSEVVSAVKLNMGTTSTLLDADVQIRNYCRKLSRRRPHWDVSRMRMSACFQEALEI